MLNIVGFAFAVILSLGCMGAYAQSSAGTAWTCWYGGETSVYCQLQSVELARQTPEPAAASGGRPLPAIVQAIRHDPASLEDKLIVIPLHTIPYDMDFVRQLAQSVMCGRKSACTVAFESNPPVSRGQSMAVISR